ncbi:citrate synthase/methylcitrate synthase [Virgibacillus profundi]|uniref:Citrate synthase n=1 Tax=Virgibacillus profundi TaxID=2024555 RepID=A0A2A2ICG7_9BACI|nr:citrate/2-methylcitrate synthase [Virgibacillus profundi]PAV29429.1 citrate synthase/methylcitrate synthase [Virgibacillus profundi]PXY53598.1 citrate synthase/methylcitrate synthase [Virgibacillus profundi]
MYQPGLKGITAVETKLCHIDGAQGVLTYRGNPIQSIVEDNTYEDAAYFLLYGNFPSTEELQIFKEKLNDNRELPAYVREILDSIPSGQTMMDVLRTTVSSLTTKKLMEDNATQLIAIIPTIIAYRYRKMKDLPIIKPDPALNHVENFMYMLSDKVNKSDVKILEAYLIMTMEHGLNASTFAARVTISTESDLISAITSAIGTMKGPLHGGAPSGVIDLLDEINTTDNISEIIHKKLKNKERIMGFGHRVYKTVDPRAIALKKKIIQSEHLPEWIKLALETEKVTIKLLNEYKPEQNLYTNVEYYAAAIMKSLELDPEIFTAIFSSSRIVGWCAHSMEQANNNTIFRPNATYIGD